MKDTVKALLEQALDSLKAQDLLPKDVQPKIGVEQTRDPAHGDWASNLAMMLAKPAGKPPRDVAQALIDALPAHPAITGVEIAGPGFINFRLAQGVALLPVKDALDAGDSYGQGQPCNDSIQVEFVSANPTGPLHVGHGRGAAYGASLSSLLAFAGHGVQREYYVNDAGRQMHILAASVWLRYQMQLGQTLPFPTNGYQGDYIADIAADLRGEVGDQFAVSADEILTDLPPDAPEGDKEVYIDAVIARGKALHGDAGWDRFRRAALDGILAGIREDLADFRVEFDQWFSEKSLMDNGDVAEALNDLVASGHTFEEKGALWFRSTAFGDDKDRVLKRDNGETTYFASDVAYIRNKLKRGFDRVIYVFGADHHGYVARMKAATQALGFDPERVEFQLVQFVSLYRNGEKAQMSTRSGEFITLEDLRQEVGNDAARIFYASRKVDVPMDFDLDLATRQSKDNPVYYVQYAHARVHALSRKLTEMGETLDLTRGLNALDQLTQEDEKELATAIGKFPGLIERAANDRAPHVLVHYLNDLAASFHGYYNATRVLDGEEDLKQARLALCHATGQVIRNGLRILGATAPEQM